MAHAFQDGYSDMHQRKQPYAPTVMQDDGNSITITTPAAVMPTPKPRRQLTFLDVLIFLRNGAGGALIGSAVGGILAWFFQVKIPVIEICSGIFAIVAVFFGSKIGHR